MSRSLKLKGIEPLFQIGHDFALRKLDLFQLYFDFQGVIHVNPSYQSVFRSSQSRF